MRKELNCNRPFGLWRIWSRNENATVDVYSQCSWAGSLLLWLHWQTSMSAGQQHTALSPNRDDCKWLWGTTGGWRTPRTPKERMHSVLLPQPECIHYSVSYVYMWRATAPRSPSAADLKRQNTYCSWEVNHHCCSSVVLQTNKKNKTMAEHLSWWCHSPETPTPTVMGLSSLWIIGRTSHCPRSL